MLPAPVTLPRWVQSFLFVFALCLAIIFGLLALQLYRSIWRPPPLAYSADVYLPVQAQVCPGDTLRWKPTLEISRAPTLLLLARTLWDVEDERTIRPEQTPKYLIWLSIQQGQTLSGETTYTLPADLPVGLYEVRSAATAMNSDAAVYRVPFVIAASCFKKGKS
ncbi:hypothetical protein DKM44_12770 [Deinococcus irradiatisoli]|uniref:Uncharacterized protein n=1 Tax=Deinococcus irradiatisoli TaxID=2202254 RepID=A0A2Z3JTR6_9DEIO|nr:hypothetical protein [Deinococcus irradiatisoli]AWN23994.1 hypothetical protein DKM44_12770 [Deinococcus irradiatisoli]